MYIYIHTHIYNYIYIYIHVDCRQTLDTMAHVHGAVVDLSVDESRHLPTTGNEACLKAAKAVSSTYHHLSTYLL